MPLPENVITICTELIDAHAGVLSKEIYTPERIKEIEQTLLDQLRNPVDLPPTAKETAKAEIQAIVEQNRASLEAATELIDDGLIDPAELAVAAPAIALAIAGDSP